MKVLQPKGDVMSQQGAAYQANSARRPPLFLASCVGACSRFLLTFLSSSASDIREKIMATFGLIEYQDASPEVRAVYDDIMATRQTDYVNNFWKAIAHDPATLKRTWESVKNIMAPGALDPLTKEMIYVAISAS